MSIDSSTGAVERNLSIETLKALSDIDNRVADRMTIEQAVSIGKITIIQPEQQEGEQ